MPRLRHAFVTAAATVGLIAAAPTARAGLTGCPTGYTRAQFGSEPTARTAQAAFKRDAQVVGWVDAWTGRPVAKSALSADHVIPLHQAWCSGAAAWSKADRRAFGADLGNLATVNVRTNSSKADRGPNAWRPASRAGRCLYARLYLTTLTKWRLGLPAADIATVKAWQKADCP